MGGGAGAGSQTDLRGGEDPVHRRCHATYQTQGNDPVELPAYGGPPGSQQVHHQQYLAESQPQTPSGENLQAVAGCQISGKVNRCGGPLSESSPTSDRALCGGKEPNP